MEKGLRIKIFSYDQDVLGLSIKKIIVIARNNNCDIKGPIPLPTKKVIFTFCGQDESSDSQTRTS